MNINDAQRLVEILNREFGYPFFKDKYVIAKFYGEEINIKIGKRDVFIRIDDVCVTGAGTEVDNPKAVVKEELEN